MTNVGKWRHTAPNHPTFGLGPSYQRAMHFLRMDGRDTLDGTHPISIEDWGCGIAGAKKYAGNSAYIGVDGSPGYADIIADLVTYRSSADCILMRHVLEHNHEWSKILSNAVASFRYRFCLIIYAPFAEQTHLHSMCDPCPWWDSAPEYHFNFEELVSHFNHLTWTKERFDGEPPYYTETIFFISRESGACAVV